MEWDTHGDRAVDPLLPPPQLLPTAPNPRTEGIPQPALFRAELAREWAKLPAGKAQEAALGGGVGMGTGQGRGTRDFSTLKAPAPALQRLQGRVCRSPSGSRRALSLGNHGSLNAMM